MAGMPVELIDVLIRQGASELTVVSNTAGNGDTGPAALPTNGGTRRMVCPFPASRTRGSQLRQALKLSENGSSERTGPLQEQEHAPGGLRRAVPGQPGPARRSAVGGPFNIPDPSSFYGDGHRGRTDYREEARGRPSKGSASDLLYALLRGRGAPRLVP